MHYVFLATIVGISLCAAPRSTLIWRRAKRLEMIKSGEYAKYLKNTNDLRRRGAKLSAKAVDLHAVDYEYSQAVSIGTPGQDFLAWVSTYSSMLWVPHVNCTSYGCKRRSKFRPDQSTTFVDLNKTWETISYGDGIASGVLGKDQLKLGVSHPDQLAVPSISFGLATTIETNYSKVDSDGMLGLAYANVVGAVNEPFILDVLNKSGLSHLFTVWLDPEPVEYLNSGGTITYGSVDDLNCGPVIQFENITTVGTYQYHIDSISMGNYTYNVTSTVTQDLEAFIVAPAVFVKEIAKIANARYDKGINLYSINCTARFPDLKIKSGSVVYEVTDRNLIINLGFNQCLLAMVPADGVMSTFSFGIPFNRQYCTIFDIDERRIGFAVALPDQRTTRRRTSSTKSTSEKKSTAATGSTVTTAPKSAARLIMTFALIEIIILLPLKPSI